MKKSFFLLCAMLSVLSLSAASLKDSVRSMTDENLALLLGWDAVYVSSLDGSMDTAVPLEVSTLEKLDSAVRYEASSKGFSIGVASLVPYPQSWSSMSESEMQLAIYNAVLKVSTLTGQTYISRTAGYEPRVLFEDSSMLLSSDRKDRVEDPQVESVPESATFYMYQKDNRFGGNVYSVTYRQSSSGLFMDITNVGKMSYMGISLLKSGDLSMSMTIVPVDEGIYVFCMANVRGRDPKVKVLLLTVDLEESFQRRVVALRNWFADSIADSIEE